MRIYLAGKMRGVPEFNAPAFRAATDWLRAEGHEVFSPAEQSEKLFGAELRKNANGDEGRLGGDEMTIGRTVFHLDLAYICLHADAVCLLPGWENSKGATAERAVAIALGLEVFEYEAMRWNDLKNDGFDLTRAIERAAKARQDMGR